MITVADALIARMQAAGVSRVFGLPGGEIVLPLDAVRRRNLPFTLARHESAATFMAAATARLTRAPSASFSTLGPGATNAVTGTAHAFLDRAPILVVTGQTPGPGHTHQLVDLQALMTPITKASLALRPVGASTTIERAFELIFSGRPGPVHLQLESGDAAREATPEADAHQIPLGETGTASLEQTGELLSNSKRPVIVAGLGLEPEAPYSALRNLAESLRAPVIVTPKAKGAISERNPLFAGTIGLTPTDPAYGILDESDCVLALGFDPVELVKPWDQQAPLIWISTWGNQDPKLAAAAELVGPLEPRIDRLAQIETAADSNWGERRVADLRRSLDKRELPEPRAKTIRPQDVLHELREALADDVVMSVDVGSHKILACLEWEARAPNRFLVSNGLSSMGYGLPAAIAASLALAGERVVCLTGDAGLAMAMGELGTLSELGTSVIIVVMNDGAHDLIRSHQHRSGLPTFGTEFDNPDFTAIAEAHSIQAQRASDLAEFERAIAQALAQSGPFLIDAQIDPSSYPTSLG